MAILIAVLALPAVAAARAGDPDPTFADGGRTAFTVGAASAHVAGIALRPDGHALITGTAAVPDAPDGATSVTQLGPTGALDLTFGAGGTLLADPTPDTDVEPAGGAPPPPRAADAPRPRGPPAQPP